MTQTIVYILICINVVTFLVYGIDKAASKRGQKQTCLHSAEREQARPKVKWKAKQGSWRISEATLLMLAVIGGTIGALLGSAIGGSAAGWRGSDMGTLVGMAGGAAVGAAIGQAADRREAARYDYDRYYGGY